MAHKHYDMCRGRRLGSNPSAQPHDPLFGRLISYYDKSKHKAREGGQVGTTAGDSGNFHPRPPLPLRATGMAETLTSAALLFIPIPENLLPLISFFPNFTLVLPHFLSPLPWIPA